VLKNNDNVAKSLSSNFSSSRQVRKKMNTDSESAIQNCSKFENWTLFGKTVLSSGKRNFHEIPKST